MKIFDKLFSWYGKRRVLAILFIIVILIAWGLLSKIGENTISDSESIKKYPLVTITTAEEISGTEQLSLVGKVRALSEVDITPDRSGRVTKIGSGLGQSVKVGQIIVELENSSERAALLQAEGAYEIAKGSLAQSDVSLREAEHNFNDAIQNVRNVNQNAYNITNNVILGTIDLFFANPNASIPGLKIGGVGNTDFLNQERIAFQTILPNWNNSLSNKRSFEEELSNVQIVRGDVKRVLDLINTFIPLLNDSRSMNGYSITEIENLRQQLTSAQGQITNILNTLDNTYTELKNANEKLERAKISATGDDNSVSDAQLKQALGTLRSAQANYEKTILRSPINGTINEMNVKVGQYITASTPIAKIANNTKSEIIIFVNDKDKENLSVGTEVMINDSIKGQIAIIAPAIDSTTQKTEVRIVSESDDLMIGDTVRVVGSFSTDKSEEDQNVTIPLTAIKFDGADAYVFIVENDTLKKTGVQLGQVRGGQVKINSGIEVSTEFVLDARGFSQGDKVEVLKSE